MSGLRRGGSALCAALSVLALLLAACERGGTSGPYLGVGGGISRPAR